MTTVLTWVDAEFDAAHCRPFGDRVHGHSWTVRAYYPEGADNRDLAAKLSEAIRPLDHVLLDEVDGLVPSNEGLARWLLDRLPGAVQIDVWRRGGGAKATR